MTHLRSPFPFLVITNCATSCAVIFILVNELIRTGSHKMFEHSELVGNTWPWAYPALCFSCGYFAYDQWDMLHYRLYSGWIPSILVHHLLLLVCFTLALYRNVTINYLILTLICEVSLHKSLPLCLFLIPLFCFFYFLVLPNISLLSYVTTIQKLVKMVEAI